MELNHVSIPMDVIRDERRRVPRMDYSKDRQVVHCETDGADELIRPAFMTGSLVYGTPCEESDVDLVLMMTEEEAAKLYKYSDGVVKQVFDPRYPKNRFLSMRFGRLNLLCCFTTAMYDSFLEGTAECYAKWPVTREAAVEVFQRIRKQKGIKE